MMAAKRRRRIRKAMRGFRTYTSGRFVTPHGVVEIIKVPRAR
tara:strand:+ start:1112 stop:1237 length:126 start_codon:yes stop_codon:yes gene_type:complete